MQIFLVLDYKVGAQAFSSFEEAKKKFEQYVGSCRAFHAYDTTFKSRFVNMDIDNNNKIKQFQASYQLNGKWHKECYSLQIITL